MDEPRNEIEVTDEMIEAGYKASRLYDRDDPKEWEIAAIYRAMEAVRRQGNSGSGAKSPGLGPRVANIIR